MFAKLFQLEDGQVLVTKEYNEEEDKHELNFRTDVDGMTIKVTAKYRTEESAQNELSAYSEQSALNFRKNILLQLGSIPY